MVSLIVAAHDKLAPALMGTATMILGPTEGVTTVTFMPGQGPDDLIAEYEQATQGTNPDDGVLILVDLFGGSPYNAGARFAANHPNADVVSGVNVPMLMEVLAANKRDGATLDTLVDKALKAGTTGVRSFKRGKPKKKTTPAATTTETNATSSPKNDTTNNDAAGAIDPNFPKDPNHTMNCVFMRIDSRLIHGQVAGSWVNHVGPQTLIAASDSAANDELRKELLLQVGPASARTNVLGVDKTIRVYYNPDYEGMKTMIVVEQPEDALALIKAGITVKELNVGGVTFKPGMKQVSEAVYASDEHLAVYKELADMGVPMILQQVPNSHRTELMGALKQKGLI